VALWLAPPIIAVIVMSRLDSRMAPVGLLASASVCAAFALTARRFGVWYRHATAVARIMVLFLAFLVPTLLLYPSINALAENATASLITEEFAVQAQGHVQHLQDLNAAALAEIEQHPQLTDLVTVAAPAENDPSERSSSAFAIWQRTALNRERLTSAIELYNAAGAQVSRFGPNFPEYTVAPQKPQTPQTLPECRWVTFGEAQPFGSEERNMLHSERGVCGPDGTVLGSIVVHVMLDYRNLPFVSSQNPYFELFLPADTRAPEEGAPGGDVDVAIYGWGLHPIYSSGRAAWAIDDAS
jgi:hypothetical protein